MRWHRPQHWSARRQHLATALLCAGFALLAWGACVRPAPCYTLQLLCPYPVTKFGCATPDLRHYAYTTTVGGREYLVADGVLDTVRQEAYVQAARGPHPSREDEDREREYACRYWWDGGGRWHLGYLRAWLAPTADAARPGEPAWLKQVVIDGMPGPVGDQVAKFGRHRSVYALRRGACWWLVRDNQLWLPGAPLAHAYGQESEDLEGDVSGDGATISYLRQVAGGWALLCNERVLAVFASTSADTKHGWQGPLAAPSPGCPVFARLGDLMMGVEGTVTFSAQQANGQWQVIHDGQPGPEYEELTGLSAYDGRNVWSYAGRRGTQWQVVVNGVPGEWWDQVERHVGGSVGMYLDGYAPAWEPSDQSSSFFEVVRARRSHVLMNGQLGPASDGFLSDTPMSPYREARLSVDLRHHAYVVRQGKQFAVVHDGVAGPPFDGISVLELSCDGQHWAYGARRGEQRVLVRDGQIVEDRAGLVELRYTADSQRLWYQTNMLDGSALYCDGRLVLNRHTWKLVSFTASAAHCQTCWQRGARVEVWYDDQRVWAGQDQSCYSRMAPRDTPLISELDDWHDEPSGIRLWLNLCLQRFTHREDTIPGATIRCGRGVLVIDGRVTEIPVAGEWGQFLWSDDGRHWIAAIDASGVGSRVVLDGQAGPALDLPVQVYNFKIQPDGTLIYAGVIGGHLYRITQHPAAR